MPLEMNLDQQATVTLAITTNTGKPAKVDGIPSWEASDTAVFLVQAAADGMSGIVAAADTEGVAGLLTVRADAYLGEGIREIVGTLEVRILGGEAEFMTLTAGTPEPKLSVNPL